MILAEIPFGAMAFICFMITLSIVMVMGLFEKWLLNKTPTDKVTATICILIWFVTAWCVLAFFNNIIGDIK